jgi:hypothetical protein
MEKVERRSSRPAKLNSLLPDVRLLSIAPPIDMAAKTDCPLCWWPSLRHRLSHRPGGDLDFNDGAPSSEIDGGG